MVQEGAETSTYILATVHGYDWIYAEQQGQLSLPPTTTTSGAHTVDLCTAALG